MSLTARFNASNMLTLVQGEQKPIDVVIFNPDTGLPADFTDAILSLNFPRQGGGTVKRTNANVLVLTEQVIVPEGGKGYVFLPDNGLVTGDVIQVATSGVLPTPLAVLTNYKVLVIDDDNFYFADTNLDPIYLTAQGSGNFTFNNANDIIMGANPLLGNLRFNLRSEVALAINASLAQTFQINYTDSDENTLILLIQNLLDVYAEPAA